MLTLLTALHDEALIERFGAEIAAAGRYDQTDNPAIIAALDRLPPPRAAALIERIVAGTATTAFGTCADLLARAVTGSGHVRTAALAGAAARLVEALPGDPEAARAEPREPWQRGSKINASVIVALLIGLGAIDATLAERSVDHTLAWLGTYGFDAVLVPVARTLAGAGTVGDSAAFERLRAACVAHLRARSPSPQRHRPTGAG